MEYDPQLLDAVVSAASGIGRWIDEGEARTFLDAVRTYDAASSQASLDDCPNVKSVLSGSSCEGWDHYDWAALRRELRRLLKLEPTP